MYVMANIPLGSRILKGCRFCCNISAITACKGNKNEGNVNKLSCDRNKSLHLFLNHSSHKFSRPKTIKHTKRHAHEAHESHLDGKVRDSND